MQGANSIVTYYPDYIIKEIIDDEFGEPLEVAAAREVYSMIRAKTGYPNIPQFHSLVGLKIKMERVEGITLDEYISKITTKEVDEARRVYRMIVEQVREIARMITKTGIQHLDLTNKNIIISPDGSIWVIDFGMTRILGPTEDQEIAYRQTMETFVDVFHDYLEYIGQADIISDVTV